MPIRTTTRLPNWEIRRWFRKVRTCAEQIHYTSLHDSIDRQTLLEDFGNNYKQLFLVKQTLTDTKSKVKFQGEISDSLGIKQGSDKLSPLLLTVC